MYSKDKDFSRDKSLPASAKSSFLRRRLTSRLQPLHGGFGFGANAIRERALVVARQATVRHSQVAETDGTAADQQNFHPLRETPQFADEKTVVREPVGLPVVSELDVPERYVLKREALNERVRRSAVVQKEEFGRLIAQQALSQAAAVPSIKSFITAPRKVQPPTLAQSLFAWFFDALVVLACLVIGFTLSASVPFVSLMAHKFPMLLKHSANQVVQVDSLGWMVLMIQTLTVASLILFCVQTIAGIFFSASIGRAIANVQITSGRSVLGRGLKIGLSELLQWPLGFGLFNAIVSPEHNFFIRSVRWARGDSRD